MKQIILLLLCFNSFLIKAQTQYKSFHFSTDDGLPSNTIYSITQDNNKNLILGTDNGLSVFNGNEFVNYNVKDGLTNPYIVSVCQEGSVIFLINYNGNIQENSAVLVESNRGFLFGDSVFETIKVLDNKVLFLE